MAAKAATRLERVAARFRSQSLATTAHPDSSRAAAATRAASRAAVAPGDDDLEGDLDEEDGNVDDATAASASAAAADLTASSTHCRSCVVLEPGLAHTSSTRRPRRPPIVFRRPSPLSLLSSLLLLLP